MSRNDDYQWLFRKSPAMATSIGEDGTYYLVANRNHTRSAPRIGRMEIRVEQNPSVATTRLLTGEADWILEATAEHSVDRGEQNREPDIHGNLLTADPVGACILGLLSLT